MSRQITLKAIDAVTATTTSDPISLEGVKKCTLQFTRADHSAGSSLFAVTVSIDGSNYVTFNKLIDNVANTNAQTLTRVASCSLASDTSKVYEMDLSSGCYKWMKVSVTETTDGTHSATVERQFEE